MMAYHSLSECTLTASERVEEASRLIEMIQPFWDDLSPKEQSFIEGMESSCSVKQLFWLRDIKDRVI